MLSLDFRTTYTALFNGLMSSDIGTSSCLLFDSFPCSLINLTFFFLTQHNLAVLCFMP